MSRGTEQDSGPEGPAAAPAGDASAGGLTEDQRRDILLRFSSDAVVLFDAGFRIIDCNERALELFGYARDELLGLGIDALRAEQPGVPLAGRQLQVAREGSSIFESVGRHRDGSTFPIETGARVVETAAGICYHATIRDITERKRMEQELLAREQDVRALFGHSPLAVLLTEPGGAIVAANRAACEMLGYREDEVLALGCDGILDAGDPRLEALLEERALTGRIQAAELTAIRKGGERFPVEVDSVLLPGDPVRAFLTLRDIGERKEMLRALQESEARALETVRRLSRAHAVGRMGEWVWDVASDRMTWADGVYRICGVPRSTPTNFEAVVRLAHPDDRDDAVRRARDLLDDPARADGVFRFRLVRPDGALRYILQTLSIDRDVAGRAVRVFGIMQDVTDVREAEEARLASEVRLAKIWEAGLFGMALWAADGTVVDANDRYLEMTGYSRSDLEAGMLDWHELTPPEYAEDDARAMARLGTRGQDSDLYEKEYFRKDGSRLPVLVAAAVIDDRAQTGLSLVVDLSEQKAAQAGLQALTAELEERVRSRTAELEAANRELESFSYSVSHDLRAPLRHISGFAGLLEEQLGETADPETRHFLSAISRSVAEMGRLIDGLLRFSRAGRSEMHVEPVEMDRLVREALDLLEGQAGERNVEVRVGEVLPAAGDVTLLRQVWANLLDNAFKYTRGRDPALVEVGSRDSGGETVYWVRDNGVGFDPRYAQRLFGVFERLHPADQFEGTGIGLANVQRIVVRHGGRCWAEAEVEAGATFFFALPAPQ